MAAKEMDEVNRILSHCIKEASKDKFAVELFTEAWKENNHDNRIVSAFSSLKGAFADYLESVFNGNGGFYSAVMPTGCKFDAFHNAYRDAVHLFTKKQVPEVVNSVEYSAMLMRSFMFIDSHAGENADDWAVRNYESSGIVTMLHPALIDMVKAQISFLFDSFSVAASQEISKPLTKRFDKRRWVYYQDMAEIKMPLTGLMVNVNQSYVVSHGGSELLHRIGSIELGHSLATTRFLNHYDVVDDDDISESELFGETCESKHLLRVIKEYCKIHVSARDGLSIAVYRNEDIQPVLAAVHAFMELVQKTESDGTNALGIDLKSRTSKYVIKIVFFSESSDYAGVTRWVAQWRSLIEDKIGLEDSLFAHFSFVISHRYVKSDDNYVQFAKTIREDIDADIFVLYNFIKPDADGCKFEGVPAYDVQERVRKFPILEQAQSIQNAPNAKLKRKQIVSNRQFGLSAAHTELVAKMKETTDKSAESYIVLATGDYAPWKDVVNAAHERSEWVVCIDTKIDDSLIGQGADEAGVNPRELIGFGSGVGLHGESNYTISTQKHRMEDIKQILCEAFRGLYPYGTPETDKEVTECLVQESKNLGGISLIRALGPDDYIHDFIAYSLMHRILPMDENGFVCSKIFSIDAYRHWFDQESEDDRTHPDLIWLKAKISDGKFKIFIRVIECKLGVDDTAKVEKAREQIKNGLRVLGRVFKARGRSADSNGRPDERYWFLQLHRLIASCSTVKDGDEERKYLAAMEKLASGIFDIEWTAGVFVFLTDTSAETIDCSETFEAKIGDSGKSIDVPVYRSGYGFVYNVCTNEQQVELTDGENFSKCFHSQPRPGRENVLRTRDLVAPAEEDAGMPPPISPVSSTSFSDAGAQGELGLPGLEGGMLPETQLVSASAPVMAIPSSNTLSAESSPIVSSAVTSVMPECYHEGVPSRILLGNKPNGESVYWEFGHKGLNNRHFLIFGNSGMGKTYAIQAILCELAKAGQNSLIVDYTNGFLPKQLATKANEVLNPMQHIVKKDKLPIYPFQKQTFSLEGLDLEDNPIDVAKRVASIFATIYNLGDQQISVLTDAIEAGIVDKTGNLRFEDVLAILEGYIHDGEHNGGSAKTVLSRLKPFVSGKPFSDNPSMSWDDIFTDSRSRCHIFQMAAIDKNTYLTLAEFLLWDLYGFVRNNGRESLPKVVVLDEIQNLDHKGDAPVAKFLTEGRKFGIAQISATQLMSNLKKDEQGRLFQSGHKLFFRPADTEVKNYAEMILQLIPGGSDKDEWCQKLSRLQKGECYSIGPECNPLTGLLATRVNKIKITALEDRSL